MRRERQKHIFVLLLDILRFHHDILRKREDLPSRVGLLMNPACWAVGQ
jgi:hypothetical protein